MKNIIRNTTQMAMLFVSHYLTPGQSVVDATCGKGNDTAALAKLGAGKIYAFDIQSEAIELTKNMLIREGLYSDNIQLICDGHENMGNYVKEQIQVAMFNLGYLPAASKEIITSKETTIYAIRETLLLLKKDGLLCITMYDGHPGGSEEKRAVLELAEGLDSQSYHVAYINMLNQPNHPPELLLITLKGSVEVEKD